MGSCQFRGSQFHGLLQLVRMYLQGLPLGLGLLAKLPCVSGSLQPCKKIVAVDGLMDKGISAHLNRLTPQFFVAMAC
ncbi:MAG: hypothetical protein C4294_06530, partial [Nitrospiraceae bacterium]